eukprot:TRINITY_DN916_c0_g1_i1.p1 TRINITY_DN916_c0_g1~~TRINITY_DN916_c0_g1_i1.p1  ORF type:complete len:343 (+),score=96.53 TRINITY_DN916_c0_g1_i1:106-1134(+)
MGVKALIAYNIHKAISANKEFAKAALSVSDVKNVVQSLIECVKRMNERVNEREAKMLAPCLDEEDVAEIAKENEDEAELSSDATDALKSLLEIYGIDILPMILMSDFEWMMSDDAHPIQRCTVLRIFCYVFETCPTDQTRELMSQTITRFIQCMDEENCDVQQAAIYAVGLVAEQLQGSFNEQMAQEILGKSFGHFNQTENEKNSFDSVLDNDASVIGKVLRYQPKAVKNLGSVYSHWLEKCFPIREDTQEGSWCYDFFCELIQSKNAAFLGDNMCNLHLILNAMADAYNTSLMSENAEKFFKNLVFEMQTNNKQLFMGHFSKKKKYRLRGRSSETAKAHRG